MNKIRDTKHAIAIQTVSRKTSRVLNWNLSAMPHIVPHCTRKLRLRSIACKLLGMKNRYNIEGTTREIAEHFLPRRPPCGRWKH
jgi:hypothetical protein